MNQAELQYYHRQYNTELFNHVVPFWLEKSPDLKYGGIYSCLDRSGKVYSTDKSVWAQGRAAYVFAKLARTYREHPDRDKWLQLSKSCIDFLNQHCIDRSDSRMYFTVTEEGNPLRKRRYFFSETFYIIGCAEYFAATGDTEALENARTYYDFVWSFYEDPEQDPYKITPKYIPCVRNTIALVNPMILLNVSSVLRKSDPKRSSLYREREGQCAASILNYFVKPDHKAVLESVGADGTIHDWYSAGRVVNPGHSIECSWFLFNYASDANNEVVKNISKEIFTWAIDRGWDTAYGGLLYFTDLLGYPPEQYEHDMKLWWPHTEALIASLLYYQETRDFYFANWFEKISAYSFEHFSDPAYGGWYGYLRRDGIPTEPACKGSTYKSGFHVIRMLIMVEQMLRKLTEESRT